MGSKDVQSDGKGGQFKVEKNERARQQSTGNASELDRYGSIGHCIESVIQSGAYISFGRTSDGGATLIRVLDGPDKLSSYCHTHGEIMEAMEALEARYKRKVVPILPIEALGNP